MSAISTVMLAFLKPGDALLISNPTYGGTHTFVYNYLKEIGVNIISFDFDDKYDDVMKKLNHSKVEDKLKMIYVETPANPTNTLINLNLN